MQPQSSFINPIAMTMATLGMGVSLYSARQMAERDLKHQNFKNSSVVLRLHPCGNVLWETESLGCLHSLNGATHVDKAQDGK
ncbi:hypothetical protein F7725_025460 [Dissostichus mawsoni]|uniref:Uncharacterized protein n=1 Tax=Dissostichus mawsoni TaxID=36200 RepID=A0A7J5XB71_DISMA|nr:hypothetical protein F7725_025460 [Dissostichus mawsoni]